MPSIDRPIRRRDGFVDRNELQRLAEVASERRDHRSRLQLWVATMMWGSGTSYGRGPWRTAQGLSSPDLGPVLAETFEAVHADDLAHSYAAFRVPGCRESFFTKWFWAASLDQEAPRRRPLVHDERVLATLRKIDPAATAWKQPLGAARYVTYVDGVHDAADLVARDGQFKGFDAEKLEWLLFDRPPRGSHFHDGTGERCLCESLA